MEIPEAWRGQVTHRQTIQKRPSKMTRKARNAEPRSLSNRRAHIEGRAPTVEETLSYGDVEGTPGCKCPFEISLPDPALWRLE